MSKSRELDRTAKQYIIDNIDREYCETKTGSPKDTIAALKRAFYAEYGWRVEQVGEQKALMDWFQGLPSACTVDFYNDEILKLAVKWGSIPENATEKQEDKILDNWFNFIAAKTGQLFRGYRVPTNC